jgi:hypothetical protein
MWLRRILAAEQAAYSRGHRAGYDDGYAQAVADMDEWLAESARILHGAVSSVVNPEKHVRRVLAAAESAERRDAAERERAFTARACATPAHLRSDAQQAAVVVPMQRRGGRR